ncbi:MAG: TFIIB-type zinc finger domain-containing protein [Lachnospiraceae bacterium]|nr:TFIIB-type zinc finger domain-containing protein [Lachnospiraceae bacterium]
MNQLTCEMCGSTDLVKQDGVYVCQTCGTKYSVEEAKKMMVEGTVEVAGTVKVDNSAFVEKCLQNARRAKQKEDWEETEKYYNMVEQNDPTNIEAIFYSSYGKAKASLVEGDLYKRQAAFKVLQNCISIIDDNFDLDKAEENKKILEEISADIFDMACSSYVYNERKNGYGVVTWTDKMETVTLFNNLGKEFMVSLEHIAKKYSDEEKQNRKYYYELALKHAEFILQNGKLASPQSFKNVIMTYHKWINEIDPSHEVPEEEQQEGNQKSSGGCYIATAVYGSYDCPQVWTLRRFRDYTLAGTWYGRAFIRVYYAISPTLVKWFGHTEWFKKMWKGKLDRMVERLQSEGIESSSYNDREW